MSFPSKVRSILNAIEDYSHPLPSGSVVLGRKIPHTIFGRAERVALTPSQIADGVTIVGTTGAGVVESARLIVSRLLDVGRRVVLVSDNDCLSFYKLFVDLPHDKELISFDDSLVTGLKRPLTESERNAISRNWMELDLIGINYQNKLVSSPSYLRDMLAGVRKRWPDRVIVFVGYAAGQVGPIEDLSNTIMMFNGAFDPVRMSGLSRSSGVMFWMHQDFRMFQNWGDGSNLALNASFLSPGEGLIERGPGAGEDSLFRFDYLPHEMMSYPFPLVLIPGFSSNPQIDLKLLDARR